MNQTLRSQSVSIADMDIYRRQPDLEQLQSHFQSLSSTKRSRNRGMVLSSQGWQKLVQAGVLHDEFGNRYTYEQLSERSLLDERTVSRLLSCEVKVDKSTLKTFFRAFKLSLEAGDCSSSGGNGSSVETFDALPHAALTKQGIKLEQLVEELIQLKQRLRDYDRLLHRLGLTESHVNQQLEA
jgi:hypothetical protein